MPKIKYKHATGVLHIGGGRFFHAGETYTVTDAEWKKLQEYDDLVEVPVEGGKKESNRKPLDKLTDEQLKKLASDSGVEVTEGLTKEEIIAAIQAKEGAGE